MPRLILGRECKQCGEPSEGRYCPTCREAQNRYFNGRVNTERYEDADGGEANS